MTLLLPLVSRSFSGWTLSAFVFFGMILHPPLNALMPRSLWLGRYGTRRSLVSSWLDLSTFLFYSLLDSSSFRFVFFNFISIHYRIFVFFFVARTLSFWTTLSLISRR